VPPALFRIREFVVINASTFLIYGALYTQSFLSSVFLQGVLGYTPQAPAAASLPIGILLSLGSTRVGTLAGRIGPRPFLVIGPFVMGIGLLWFARIPPTSQPWVLDPGAGALLPPSDFWVDVFPAQLLFGIGITLVVAPLTTALMASIPVRNAGLGSAINNAVSRVGQPLLLAILFIAISASFYDTLQGLVPGLDPSSAVVRQDLQPLNPPAPTVPPDVATAADQASTDAFRLAMLFDAGLLFAGALVNRFGLKTGGSSSRRRTG
jgi:hypothetical protein